MVEDGLTINPGITRPANTQSAIKPLTAENSQPEKPRLPRDEESLTVQKKIDPEVLARITDEINNDFRIFNTAIQFDLNTETGNTIIKILDRDTEKVIREIPPSELLDLAAKLAEVIGRIVDESA